MDASNRDEHFSASGRTPEMGLNRHRRFLPGLVRTGKDHRLVPDLPSLDPRDTADLLAHVLEISRLIRFFESGDTALGHWDDVLSLSPSILSAGFLEHGARTESRMHAISSHLFSGSDTGRAAEGPVMGSAMAPAAKSDADALALLGAEYLWQKKWEDAFRRAGTPCDLPDIRFPDPEANQMPGDRVSYRNAALVLGLRRSRLTAHAGAILDAALLNPQGRLQPHEGMLVSVLHLFHPVRRQQDDLVSRYTDYFLETMPHTRPAPLRPDRVLITCGASGPAGFTLPAGTRLEASAALPLVYTTESEAFIRDFSIQKIQSIVPLNPPGPFYKSLVWTEFAAERGKTIRDLFGQAGRSGTFHTCVSLVSLPGLELSGGTRTLDMALVLAPETGEAVSGGPELSGVLKNGGKTLFDLALSTAEGWVTPENPTVDLSPWTWPPGAAQDPIQAEKAENPFSAQGESGLPFSPDTGPGEAHRWQLRLSFTLPPDVPALCPPDLETHGISTSAPALCIRPKDEKSPFWRKLKDFSLRRIHVSIQVRGLRAFNRLSDGGWMVHTPDMAVESFGTLPGTGSAFTLAVPEFRGKKLKTLRLGWNWEAPDDFAGYFRAYDFFPVKIVPDFQSQADAWETLDEPRTLSGKKDDTLDCPLPPHGKIRAYRWRLVSTGSLFGHRDYPHLLTRATLNESTLIRRIGRAITHGIRLKDLNPPYTPVWSDITLDYAAEVTCFPEPGEHLVRYLHPHADPFPEKPETPFLFFHQNTHALALSLDFPEPENRPVPLSLYFRVQNRTENTAGQPFQVDGAD
ncbi:hypothetical protein LJC47_07565, partial [Desulfosarcina sp. OttesenSCG-928-B08]|nr:hypothetical protein [Desulfosarcina sp. OttesenSCG-928-B08]